MATDTATRPGRRSSGRPRHVMHRDIAEDAVKPNPLRAGTRLERVPDPSIVVVFGATGDLAHRKILPAFYNLRRAGLMPLETSIVGYSRRPYSDAELRGRDARRRRGALSQSGRAGALG